MIGNGANWGLSARNKGGYNVTQDKPIIGTAVSMKGGQFSSISPEGHVAFVETLADDGLFLISEANIVEASTGKVSFRVIPSGKGLTFISGKANS